jgi:nucleotide-binding universal stress UspA family protein
VNHRTLLAFELPDAAPLSQALARDLAGMEIVALGHYGLPEQTPPDAGRDQFGDEAAAELARLTEPLTERGATVETRVVFGRARGKTIDRVATEEGCDVVFVPGGTETAAVDSVFVPLRGGENTASVVSFAAALAAASDATVTVFHDSEESDRRPGEALIADAVERLTDGGVARDRIDTQLATADEVGQDIVERAREFDVVVLGESDPSLTERLLGARSSTITFDTDRPAFVVGDPERRE